MARIRSIKPEFWSSLTVARLSVNARLTFIGLWNYVDDCGRAKDDVRLVKAAVWPLDDSATSKRIEGWLSEIAGQSLIVRYEVEGKRYLEITNWKEHQKVDHPKPSMFPQRSATEDSRKMRESLAKDSDGAARDRADIATVREALGPDGKGAGRGTGKGNGEEQGGARQQAGGGSGSDWAVDMLRRKFGKDVPLGAQEEVRAKIRDRSIWERVLSIWNANSYDPNKPWNLIDRYERELAKRDEPDVSGNESSRVHRSRGPGLTKRTAEPDWKAHYFARLEQLVDEVEDERKAAVQRLISDLPRLSYEEFRERVYELQDTGLEID